MRLVTNPRIFKTPSTVEEAWRFIVHIEEQPAAVYADVDAMTFGVFKHLSQLCSCIGNDVPDALLAASAIRPDAELLTAGAGFGRFPGLRVKML